MSLKIMRPSVKSRREKEDRDKCMNPDCGVEVKVDDKYATFGVRGRHIYCEKCAERNNMVSESSR